MLESSTCLPRWLEIKRTGDGVSSSPVSAMSYSRDHHHKTENFGGWRDIYKTLLLLLYGTTTTSSSSQHNIFQKELILHANEMVG
jgi:hypothetical protein